MKLDGNKFKNKFGNWWRYMQEFVEGEKMYSLYQKLKEYGKGGVTITPLSSNTFKAFEICPPENTRVIFIGSDPYPGRYNNGVFHATGISFDNSHSPEGYCQPTLSTFHNGIANEYGMEVDCTNNLYYLCEQGVLLLNRALTTGYGRIGEHIGWWDEFYEYFLGQLNMYFRGLPIVLIGEKAWELSKYITPLNNPVFKIEHPFKAHSENREWKTEGIFRKLNEILYSNNKESICWHSKLYKEELPF